MRRTCTQLFMLILVMLLCTSCWDRRELDDISIVKAIGFDKDGEGIRVTLQVINPKELMKNASGYDTPFTIYQDTGKTVMETIRQLTKQMPRKAYFSHLRVVVISEELAKDGFSKVIDFLMRDHELRSDFYFMVSKGSKAKDVVSVLTPHETVTANKLYGSIESAEKAWGTTIALNVDDLASQLISDGRELVLPGLKLQGSPKEGETEQNVKTSESISTLIFDELAVFDKDRLIGWLTDEDSKMYNFIESKITSTVIDAPCQDGPVGIELFNSKSKVKGDMKKDKPVITITVKSFGNLSDVECGANLLNLSEFNKINHDAERALKNNIEEVIKKVQSDYKVDIFGFGEAIHRAAPKEWKKLKDNWNSEFEDLTVHVLVDVNIKHESTIRKSINQSLREKK